MSQKSEVSWLLFLPIIVLAGGLAVAALANRSSPPDVIAQQVEATQESDSWWVANRSLTECFQTSDPQTLSKKMRADGKDSRVTKSWQYKGRYDINWTSSDGRYMEQNVYPSKGACEHDQQITR